MSNKVYKVGIIGMGRMGRIRKDELDLHPNFEVVAVTDINKSVDREYPNLFKSEWKEVADSDIDCIFICTFNDVIADLVCYSLEKGLHVFSEKPPGKSPECIKRMIRSEEKAKDRILKFGFNHRVHGSVLEAKKKIQNGDFGKIIWARGSYGKSAEESFEKVWRSDIEKSGGGILLDQGIHMADLLLHFLGDIKEIKSMCATQYWDIPMEDNAFALLKSENGAIATLHSSATHWKNHFSLEIGLENGLFHLEGILSNSMTYAPELLKIYKKDLSPTNGTRVGKPKAEIYEFTSDQSWKFELEDFYNSLKESQKPMYGSSEDALKVMNLIFGIYNNG